MMKMGIPLLLSEDDIVNDSAESLRLILEYPQKYYGNLPVGSVALVSFSRREDGLVDVTPVLISAESAAPTSQEIDA